MSSKSTTAAVAHGAAANSSTANNAAATKATERWRMMHPFGVWIANVGAIISKCSGLREAHKRRNTVCAA
jgi:hypothetical protein